MSRQAAWEFGFWSGVANSGLTPTELDFLLKTASCKSAFVDTAADMVAALGVGGLGLGKALTSSGISLVPLTLATPAVLGAAVGVGASALESPSKEDFDTLRKAELVSTLRKATAEIRARMKARVEAEAASPKSSGRW